MQIADFVTKFPTPDPLPLRIGAPSSRFAAIDGADRRGGVETLVTETKSKTHVFGHNAFARPPAAFPTRHQYSTPPHLGGRALDAGQDNEADRDTDDLEERFRRLSPWLERTLRFRYGGATDIEDIVQESFLRLAKYAPESRGLHPRALLLRIAGNLARDDHRRSRSRGRGHHMSIDAPGFTDGLLATPADQHAQLAIKQAIMKLPQPLRDVFLLARFTPMTHAEIASRLGISTKTVEWRMSKAMALCLAELRD